MFGAETTSEKAVSRNRAVFDGPFGFMYGFYMERERLSRAVGRLVWGSDVRPLYSSMEAIMRQPRGATIVDAPCGAGVAFRGLAPGQQVRYLAVDISDAMLERARRRAAERGLRQVELVRADARAIPLGDGEADLFLSYFGLHCFPEPEAAVREAARCLRGGAPLVGASIVRTPKLRHRLFVRPNSGAFGAVGTASDLGRWLEDAGLEAVNVDARGAFAYFSATSPSRA